MPMVIKAQTTAAKIEARWALLERVMVLFLVGRVFGPDVRVTDYATRLANGATAGATLMPMVMKAQTMAANTEAIWLLLVKVMSFFLL